MSYTDAMYDYLGFCEAQPELREDLGGVREILCDGEPDADGTVRLVIYRDGEVDTMSRKTHAELLAFHREQIATGLTASARSGVPKDAPVPVLEKAMDVDAYFAVLMASDVPWPQLALQFVRKNAKLHPKERARLAVPESPRPKVVSEVDEPVVARRPPPRSLRLIRPPQGKEAWRNLVLRRAPSKEAWLLRIYTPVALFAAFYASFLTSLGILTEADWENGACSLAVLTAPFVVTISLALGISLLGEEDRNAA